MPRRYHTHAVYFDNEGHQLTNKRDRIAAKLGNIRDPQGNLIDHYPTNYQAIATGDIYSKLRRAGQPITFGEASHLAQTLRETGQHSFINPAGQVTPAYIPPPGPRLSNRPQRGPYVPEHPRHRTLPNVEQVLGPRIPPPFVPRAPTHPPVNPAVINPSANQPMRTERPIAVSSTRVTPVTRAEKAQEKHIKRISLGKNNKK